MWQEKFSTNNTALWFFEVLLLASIPMSGSLAQHAISLEVPNTIPTYCQEANNWCGAATGQMTLEGYPGGVEHPFTQTHVWNRIVAHRDDPGAAWATDPDGLRETLMELGGDPGVNWNIHSNSNAQSLMYSITYWMTRREYPTPVLVDPGGSPYGSFQHWVMVEGFTTDVDPTTNATVNLQFIDIVDPWNPPCATNTAGGVRQTVSGATWYTTYWGVPGNYPASKWHGNYVAVIEPPIKKGVVKAKRQVEEGKVISQSAAKEHALKWFKKLGFEKRATYAVLRGTVPLGPLLINQEKRGYYLVPFGYKEGQLSQGAVLVNAYTGEFEEIGVFQRPFTYLDRERAVRLALSYLDVCKEKGLGCAKDRPLKVQAELIFQTSAQTQNRFMPIWQITFKERTVYVTQQERVYDTLTPMLPGD